MPLLIIFRHAKAAQPLPRQEDFARPLTDRGRRDAAAMGKILGEIGIDYALVSPALRTRETWEIASSQIEEPPRATYEPNLYLGSARMLMTRLPAIPQTTRNAVIVGHNPGLHELSLWLAGKDDRLPARELRMKFPTAAMAIFRLEIPGWEEIMPARVRLERFVTPGMEA
jgi:phosphohistidine phosphatase